MIVLHKIHKCLNGYTSKPKNIILEEIKYVTINRLWQHIVYVHYNNKKLLYLETPAFPLTFPAQISYIMLYGSVFICVDKVSVRWDLLSYFSQTTVVCVHLNDTYAILNEILQEIFFMIIFTKSLNNKAFKLTLLWLNLCHMRSWWLSRLWTTLSFQLANWLAPCPTVQTTQETSSVEQDTMFYGLPLWHC